MSSSSSSANDDDENDDRDEQQRAPPPGAPPPPTPGSNNSNSSNNEQQQQEDDESDDALVVTTHSGNSSSNNSVNNSSGSSSSGAEEGEQSHHHPSSNDDDDDDDNSPPAMMGGGVVLVRRRRPHHRHQHRPKKQKDAAAAAAAAAVEPVSAAASRNDLPEDEYRKRVYGIVSTRDDDDSTTTGLEQPPLAQQRRPSSSSSLRRRLSRSLSHQWQRRRSSLQQLVGGIPPETTPAGWTVLLSAAAGAALSHELAVQRQLTAPPAVYGQGLLAVAPAKNNNNNNKADGDENGSSSSDSSDNSNGDDAPIRRVYQTMLKQQPERNVLTRPIQPSLFVGTRSLLSSAAAYLGAGPQATAAHVRFREIFTLPADGAQLAIDWELPPAVEHRTNNNDDAATTSTSPPLSVEEQRRQQQQEVLRGPIRQPVVLILHGINNHAGFGYVRSLMRACADRGWIAAGFNFRGCGGVPLRTPRLYNGAHTGDLRGVVHFLSRRFHDDDGPLLFLVGNSLGANLVAKYLGEEGRCGSLPACVAGGVTMGNPMKMYSGDMNPLYSPLIAAGAKRGVLGILKTVRGGMCRTRQYRDCIWNALTARTLAEFDEAMAPIFVRNDPDYPFAHRVGYYNDNGGGGAYGRDASSYRQVPFVSVPLLQLIAKDDFLVFRPFSGRMAYNLCNPNVMVMQTTCGGHLGWHEAPPNGGWGLDGGTSWADTAMVDFIQAVLDTNREAAAAAASAEPKTTAAKSRSEQQQQSAQRRVAQNTVVRSRL